MLKPLESMVKSPWITIPPRSARCLPTDFPVNWTNAPTTSAECLSKRQKKNGIPHGFPVPSGFWCQVFGILSLPAVYPRAAETWCCWWPRLVNILVNIHGLAKQISWSTMVFTTRREMWLETTNYPLVIINGYKWPFRVDLPIKNCDFP